MYKKLSALALTLILTASVYGQWVQQTSGANSPLSDVYFLNEDTGFVTGIGVILKTTNGGVTWIPSFTVASYALEAIWFTSPLNGFAVGQHTPTLNSAIVKTIDGGQTWSISNLPGMQILQDVQFVNPSIGFIVSGNGEAFKTTDGGSTWNTMNTGTSDILR